MRRVPTRLEAALFGRLIDHAPLFPPARLPVAEALEEHRRARAGSDGWIVRRFVCPASRLDELEGEELALSVVLDADADLDDPRIESVEIPPDDTFLKPVSVESYVEVVPATVQVFAETIAQDRTQLKLRCGPDPPSVEDLAGAVGACRERGIRFKATAGLHHAVRRDGEHGFLNVLAAAVFGDEEAALAEDHSDAFRVDGDAFRWRDREASVADVERGRRLFVAFGSCSFSEPVDDLRGLGLLHT
jgi:hypothetical protein